MNTSAIAPRAAFLAAVFLSCAAPAYAQPLSTSSPSAEWLAVDCGLIVRAVIDNVTELDPDDSFHRYQTVSIRVFETTKGKHSDRLKFVHDGDFGPFRLADLKKNKQEVLIFLEHWNRSGRFNRSQGGYAYTRFPHVVKSVAILTPDDVQLAGSRLPIRSSDLTPLSTPEQLIDTVKNYLKKRRDRGLVRAVTFGLPATSIPESICRSTRICRTTRESGHLRITKTCVGSLHGR